MTGAFDLRPPQRATRGMTGVPLDLTIERVDLAGDPVTVGAVDLYVGGPVDSTWPLPDPLGDVTKITGTTADAATGVWSLALPGQPAGVTLLRVVIDDVLAARLIHSVGSEGSVAPSDTLTVRDGDELVLRISALAGSESGGTVDVVAREAAQSAQDDIDLHAAATTAAHGGIVASIDPRLSDARTPTAHTHPWSDITDAPSPGSPVWGGIGGTLADQTDLNNALGAKADTSSLGDAALLDVGTTSGTVAAGNDARIPPTPVGQANGRMLAVASNAWTVVDAPSGGGAALPSIVPVGAYASQPGPYTTGGSTFASEGRATWTALWVPAGTWDAIGIWVTTTTAAVLRVCLDTMSATTGLPTALVSDAGTVDCSTTTGMRLLTFSSPIVRSEPGWLWGRVVNTTSTSPTLGLLNASSGCMWPPGIGDEGGFNNRSASGLNGSAQATGAGEPPAPGSFVPATASTARVWLRRSA